MNDPYDSGGTPKYSTASTIYDALCDLVQTKEMGILSEMFADVSWDNQDYDYTVKGNRLKDRFDAMTGYGDRLWLLDLAIWQMDVGEVHSMVYEALTNEDMAKRTGFKKLFIEHMLRGISLLYTEATEAYLLEVQELNRFSRWEMIGAFNRAMESIGQPVGINPYDWFCDAYIAKLRGLHLVEETKLVAECRALLTGYDDFIFGLRTNQHLYTTLENSYSAQVRVLREAYDAKVQQLMMLAESQGIVLQLPEGLRMLGPGGVKLEMEV